jgi:hypothetical protein
MFARKMFALCVASICVMFFGADSIRAQQLVSARVLFSEGQVEIHRQPGDRPHIEKIVFSVADELKAGDTIITGKKGRLVLGLSDGSQAVIAPQTTVVIKELSQSPRTIFNLIRGKTRVHIEKLGGQPNPYRVNTPTAIIAVRGTVFDVLVGKVETQVFLHEGEVEVASLNAPDRAVFLAAGQMTRVPSERLPNAPVMFKAGRNDGIFKADRDGRNDGSPQDNRRVAVDGQSRDSGRGVTTSNRGHTPDFDRGAGPSNGRGGPESNAGQRNGGRKH